MWKYHLLYCEGAGFSRNVALIGEENLAVFLIHSCKVACITCCIVSHTSVSPCESLLFAKWFVSNHQNPNSWTLMVSKKKSKNHCGEQKYPVWGVGTVNKKLLWSEALWLLILWLITRYHNKSRIRIRMIFHTSKFLKHFIGIALLVYPWGGVIWRRNCGKHRYSEYTTCAITTSNLQGIAWKHPQESLPEAGSGNGLAWCETTTSTWHLNDLKLGRHEIQHGLLETCKKLWSMVSLKNFLRLPLKIWYALCWIVTYQSLTLSFSDTEHITGVSCPLVTETHGVSNIKLDPFRQKINQSGWGGQTLEPRSTSWSWSPFQTPNLTPNS